MRRALLTFAASAAVLLGSARDADAAKRRVVVGGREDDAISARVQNELVAMGFDVVRIDAAEGCARSAIAQRVREVNANAATCTDGDAVGVWVVEPGGMRLRDVVVARTSDEQQRDMAAVRAAEIARASLELVESDAEPTRAKPAPAGSPAPSAPPDADRPAAPATPKQKLSRIPAFVAGAGMSTLMGVDASVAAFSAEAEIGIGRWLSVAPRLDYPIEWHNVQSGSLKARPGFTGITAVLPLTHPSAFVIPRLGAGLGVAWIEAESTETFRQQFNPDGSVGVLGLTRAGTDSTWSPAGYLSAALSMRIGGPVRMTVDGALGTTVSRLVVRTQSVDRAYWGTPFGALALRAELLFK